MTLEREAAPAHFFRKFPRHRRLISLNKVHTRSEDPEIRLRWDWNSLLNDSPELLFPKFSAEYFPHADDMTRYLDEFQRLHGLKVRYGVRRGRVSSGRATASPCTRRTPSFAASASSWRRAGGSRTCRRSPGLSTPSATRTCRSTRGPSPINGCSSSGRATRPSRPRPRSSATRRWCTWPAASRCAWRGTPSTRATCAASTARFLDSYQFKTLHSVLDCHHRRDPSGRRSLRGVHHLHPRRRGAGGPGVRVGAQVHGLPHGHRAVRRRAAVPR